MSVKALGIDAALALVTIVFLVTAEVYALEALATNGKDHADILAGAMAAAVSAILLSGMREPVRGWLTTS